MELVTLCTDLSQEDTSQNSFMSQSEISVGWPILVAKPLLSNLKVCRIGYSICPKSVSLVPSVYSSMNDTVSPLLNDICCGTKSFLFRLVSLGLLYGRSKLLFVSIYQLYLSFSKLYPNPM